MRRCRAGLDGSRPTWADHRYGTRPLVRRRMHGDVLGQTRRVPQAPAALATSLLVTRRASRKPPRDRPRDREPHGDEAVMEVPLRPRAGARRLPASLLEGKWRTRSAVTNAW